MLRCGSNYEGVEWAIGGMVMPDQKEFMQLDFGLVWPPLERKAFDFTSSNPEESERQALAG